MKNNFRIALFFGGMLYFFTGCNSVKYVPENSLLLTKNTIYVNKKKNVDDAITAYIVQRPNQLVLGVPFPLYFYNLGNKNFETDYNKWKKQHPKWHGFTAGIFSEKQSRAIRKFKYNTNQWFLNNGEAPVLLDSKKTTQTIENLTQQYFNEGFFKVQVSSKNIVLKNKKVSVNYFVDTDKPFKIDSISTKIDSKVLDSIYKTTKNESFIQSGKQFQLANFIKEQNRITNLFRNSGIYKFNRNAITYEADSSNTSYKTNIALIINDSIANLPYQIKKIKNINIYTDYSYNKKDEPIKDSISFNGYKFLTHDKLKYNPKYLLNSIFIEPNEIYKDDNRELTRRQLRELKNFRSVDIKYTELPNNWLDASIYLTPLKKYAIGINSELTHSNIRQLGVSGKISFLNRNIFKGGEIFRFSIQGSFLNSKDAADNSRLLNASEIGSDISLEIPRFLLPFNLDKLIPKKRSPKTNFTIGTSLQQNIGLDQQKFTAIIGYTWETSTFKKHSFELLNAQYIKNLNINSYFNIYASEFNKIQSIATTYFNTNLTPQTVISFIENNINSNFKLTNPTDYNIATNIKNRYNIITENAIVPSAVYTFTYNNSKNYKDIDFSFFRIRFVSSGNIASIFSQQKDTSNTKTLFNTPISQYLKTDLEYKKFWGMSNENVLAFRSFLGIAIPYGNSSTIPFSRSYFIGGPNDLRAWKIYDLGPGSTKNGLEYNIGNLKFLANLEYRFKILNSFKGALFLDSGNIWDITNSLVADSQSKFKGVKSIREIAVGSGFGMRYDLSFILLRLDIGFKTYEPYISGQNKWFQHYNFSNSVYNFGISYPF